MRALAGQLFTDFASRPVKVPPDGSLRHLHHVGDVIDFTALDFAQHKGRPLLHIQGLGCLLIVAVDPLAAKRELGEGALAPRPAYALRLKQSVGQGSASDRPVAA